MHRVGQSLHDSLAYVSLLIEEKQSSPKTHDLQLYKTYKQYKRWKESREMKFQGIYHIVLRFLLVICQQSRFKHKISHVNKWSANLPPSIPDHPPFIYHLRVWHLSNLLDLPQLSSVTVTFLINLGIIFFCTTEISARNTTQIAEAQNYSSLPAKSTNPSPLQMDRCRWRKLYSSDL